MEVDSTYAKGVKVDWSKIMRDYRGKWVALADDQKTVVASAESAIDASSLAKKKGYEKPPPAPSS